MFRIYKKNMQAICDSAALNTKDSLLQLFGTPILWSNHSQATAKTILVNINQSTVKGFKLEGKAFLIQQSDSLKTDKFNQMAGKTIEGFINKDTIRRVTITGSAEIIYYPKNKNKSLGLKQNKLH